MAAFFVVFGGGPPRRPGAVVVSGDSSSSSGGSRGAQQRQQQQEADEAGEDADGGASDAPAVYTYTLVAEFPHDPQAFTQGLQFDRACGGGSCRDVLWESTGLNGRSSVREVELQSGKVLRSEAMPRKDFGEGLTRFKDRRARARARACVCEGWRVHAQGGRRRGPSTPPAPSPRDAGCTSSPGARPPCTLTQLITLRIKRRASVRAHGPPPRARAPRPAAAPATPPCAPPLPALPCPLRPTPLSTEAGHAADGRVGHHH